MNDTIPDACELLGALAAVREALDIPHAATAGGQETRDAILTERAGHAVVMLQGILDLGDRDITWSAAYLRERLAEHPAEGYKTWDERVAELDAAKALPRQSRACASASRSASPADLATACEH